MIKQEGLYQNKVNSSLGSIHNCKMAYWQTTAAACRADPHLPFPILRLPRR